MKIFIICLIVIICIPIAIIAYVFSNDPCDYIIGLSIGVIIGILILTAATIDKPTAIDVYRGNTELKISYINSIPQDTVIIFKDK